MREIATDGTYPYRRSYLMHKRLILDVWYSGPGQIVIYTEHVIDEPHGGQIRTFLLEDRRLCTQTANWLTLRIPSWETFLSDPTSYFMEVMV